MAEGKPQWEQKAQTETKWMPISVTPAFLAFKSLQQLLTLLHVNNIVFLEFIYRSVKLLELIATWRKLEMVLPKLQPSSSEDGSSLIGLGAREDSGVIPPVPAQQRRAGQPTPLPRKCSSLGECGASESPTGLERSAPSSPVPKKRRRQRRKIASPTCLPPRAFLALEAPGALLVSMPAFTTNPIDERRAAVAKAAVMDGDWDAANALSCPVLITNGQAKWEPYEWKILQKAKETVTTYGLRSEAAKNIIQYVYTTDLLCPGDCASIASLLLTPSQLLIFEREWKRLAAEEASKHRQVGDLFYAIQPDMLTGHGAYASSAVQLTYPVEMHQLTHSLALRAMLLVPDKKKSPP
ncbi:hypothetical protein HGM15179_020165 [Zosterops borbonicus]|uniref:Uncharacterized protein n=1 Tax=Zosterops borbonicus TaxID=364589 RepID=A0A8K1D988_9PASS|nr:hypothetical protein HGM15179_020165 [Zosterops borbonicus]